MLTEKPRQTAARSATSSASIPAAIAAPSASAKTVPAKGTSAKATSASWCRSVPSLVTSSAAMSLCLASTASCAL